MVERRPEKAGVASSILAPGTIHACKWLFPEKVYLTVGFKAGLPVFRYSFKGELSDLRGQECPGLVNRSGIGQHITQTIEARNGERAQLIKRFSKSCR